MFFLCKEFYGILETAFCCSVCYGKVCSSSDCTLSLQNFREFTQQLQAEEQLQAESPKLWKGMNRQDAVVKILADLKVFHQDVDRLISQYDVPWLGWKIQEAKIYSSAKMATDQKYLYICMSNNGPCVGRFTVDTLQLIDKFTLEKGCGAVDISGNELFVCDYDLHSPVALKVFDIETKVILRQWKPPTEPGAIKVHGENLYYGCYGIIYIYNLSGGLIKQFGKKGSGNGEFYEPTGIDIDDKFIYITDYQNHRVQVFNLENCNYSHQWGSQGTGDGQFTAPIEVRLYEGLCYVGDENGIQVFTTDGQFLYRFRKGKGDNEFHYVYGIVIVDNRLYVSDPFNHRLVVLQ